MKKSINLYFNNTIPTKEKLDAIKQCGYDEFFTGINETNETMTLKEQCEYAKQLGLNCTMIHCSYDEKILDNFWLKNKVGTYVYKNYARQIKKAHKYTKNFVVHLHGDNQSTTSSIGLKRLQKLVNLCKKYDMNLCVENLYSETELPYIFQHIKDKHLKMCVDYGHINFLTPHATFVDKYNSLIAVVHIHDNKGKKDSHRIIGQGNIDWENVAKGLSKKTNIVLSSEIKYNSANYKKTLEDNFVTLQNLDNMITKYKKSE